MFFCGHHSFLNHSKELRVGLLGSSGRFPVCLDVCLSVHFCAGDAVLRDAVLPLLTRLLYDCVNAILYLHDYIYDDSEILSD